MQSERAKHCASSLKRPLQEFIDASNTYTDFHSLLCTCTYVSINIRRVQILQLGSANRTPRRFFAVNTDTYWLMLLRGDSELCVGWLGPHHPVTLCVCQRLCCARARKHLQRTCGRAGLPMHELFTH